MATPKPLIISEPYMRLKGTKVRWCVTAYHYPISDDFEYLRQEDAEAACKRLLTIHDVYAERRKAIL